MSVGQSHLYNRRQVMIYFICYPRGDKNLLTVIDLASATQYEKNEWDVTTPHEFDNRNEAIAHARGLARDYGLQYKMFESRYDHALNEYLGEFPPIQ